VTRYWFIYKNLWTFVLYLFSCLFI